VPALAVLLAAPLLALTACGSATDAASNAPGGDKRTTPQALAYAAATHSGEPHSAGRSSEWDDEFGGKVVATEMRYGAGAGSDGDLLSVAVGRRFSRPGYTRCADVEPGIHCARLDEGSLLWEEEAPEEDPGNVLVVLDKGTGKERVTVVVLYSGPTITADPRDLDLPISLDRLSAVARDARVDLTTSQDALDAGADLDYWES
jgi:hypothetical protein